MSLLRKTLNTFIGGGLTSASFYDIKEYMADNVKVKITERNGVELEFDEELALEGGNVVFDNSSNGFTSDTTQGAIEEARETAAGFPRAGLALVNNGTAGNNDLISYSNLTPNTPIVFPVNTQLNELTFANNRNSIECDLEVWDGGVTSGTLVKTINVSTGGTDNSVFDLNADNLVFNAGDFIQIRYKDQGTNARDMVLVLWISRIP